MSHTATVSFLILAGMQFRSVISFSLSLLFLWTFTGAGVSLTQGLDSSEGLVVIHNTCPKKLSKHSGIATNFKSAHHLQIKEIACTTAFRIESFQWTGVVEMKNFEKFSYHKTSEKSRYKDPAYPPPKSGISLAS